MNSLHTTDTTSTPAARNTPRYSRTCYNRHTNPANLSQAMNSPHTTDTTSTPAARNTPRYSRTCYNRHTNPANLSQAMNSPHITTSTPAARETPPNTAEILAPTDTLTRRIFLSGRMAFLIPPLLEIASATALTAFGWKVAEEIPNAIRAFKDDGGGQVREYDQRLLDAMKEIEQQKIERVPATPCPRSQNPYHLRQPSGLGDSTPRGFHSKGIPLQGDSKGFHSRGFHSKGIPLQGDSTPRGFHSKGIPLLGDSTPFH
ncbi:putative proline-rich protein 2-like [Penaeus vannamei]|uniref:Putative proline-rich protein 2-like n=1 Tax=Penaeus vannamei TaxID=6689 RepID=A0A423TEG3_PENVA|nr:putative proline-rich protein 2-like [Penaeus vannamei]